MRIVQETGSSLSAEEVNQIRDARTKYANNLAAAQLKVNHALNLCSLKLNVFLYFRLHFFKLNHLYLPSSSCKQNMMWK